MKIATGLRAVAFFLGIVVSVLTLDRPLFSALTGFAAAGCGVAAVALAERARRRR